MWGNLESFELRFSVGGGEAAGGQTAEHEGESQEYVCGGDDPETEDEQQFVTVEVTVCFVIRQVLVCPVHPNTS